LNGDESILVLSFDKMIIKSQVSSCSRHHFKLISLLNFQTLSFSSVFGMAMDARSLLFNENIKFHRFVLLSLFHVDFAFEVSNKLFLLFS
jgi:hypothetical protein